MKKKEEKNQIYINNTHPCQILFRNHFLLGNNFGVFKVFIITVRLILFIKNSFMNLVEIKHENILGHPT